MPYRGPAMRALFRQLVDDFGGYDATAAFLSCSKGTISKMIHGDATIGAQHFCPLEDALGRWPITDLIADRRERMTGKARAEAELIRTVFKENGELSDALVKRLTGSDKCSGEVIKEAREAHEAIGDLMRQLEARGEG